MLLKSHFDAKLAAAVVSRPAAAAEYQAGDPRLLAMMSAMASMLAAFSAQLDVAESEPFLKARDGTVLADASLKGILPVAKPARARVAVVNASASSLTIGVGRRLVDSQGRSYAVDAAATIAAGSSAMITATQSTTRTVQHTVAGAGPFYEVQITPAEDGDYLASVDVSDQIGAFTYTPDFVNVTAGQRVFHVETDEYRRMWVRFGVNEVGGTQVGHQPADGDIITMVIKDCVGQIQLGSGTTFSLEVVASADESELTMTLDGMETEGADPPTMELLRVLTRYPATHYLSAVYLGDFDALVRRFLPGAEFLAVWNERAQEFHSGASVDNINRLFISASVPSQTWAATQAQVTQIIQRADDSYRLTYVAHTEVVVPITVTASVSVVHDTADVASQIRTVLVTMYGKGSANAALGFGRTWRMQAVHEALKASVPALQDSISDFNIVIGDTPTYSPEQFRYLSSGSTVVSVARVTDPVGLWSL
jgi:hypothetical protein